MNDTIPILSNSCKPKVLLLRQISFHVFDVLNPIFLTHNVQIIESVVSFINEWNNDLDFFVTKTSGSTGIPKEIKLLKKHAIQSSLNTAEALSLQKGDHAFLCLSPDTIGGKMMILRSIVLELQLIVGDVCSNPLENCDSAIDFMAIVPLQLKELIEHSIDKLHSIKHIIVGGGIISEQLEHQLVENNLTVYQTFGMTETISHIALKKVGLKGTKHFEVLPNIEIAETNGQLEIHAPSLGVNHLLTTDCIELIDPTHFNWLGRTDFVINSGGIKIHPEEIEKLLSKRIPIPFFIAGVEDEKFGQKVIIVIEQPFSNAFTLKSFYSSLPSYHIPKEVWFFESFEYTQSSKINRVLTMKNKHAARIQQIS